MEANNKRSGADLTQTSFTVNKFRSEWNHPVGGQKMKTILYHIICDNDMTEEEVDREMQNAGYFTAPLQFLGEVTRGITGLELKYG